VISVILMMLFCLAIAIFAVQNTTVVPLKFLIWQTPGISLAMLVVASAGLGMILSFFLSIPTHHKRRKQLKQREKELSDLRDAIGKH
jgi:uncharacterized integral membrane protein